MFFRIFFILIQFILENFLLEFLNWLVTKCRNCTKKNSWDFVLFMQYIVRTFVFYVWDYFVSNPWFLPWFMLFNFSTNTTVVFAWIMRRSSVNPVVQSFDSAKLSKSIELIWLYIHLREFSLIILYFIVRFESLGHAVKRSERIINVGMWSDILSTIIPGSTLYEFAT